MTPTSRSTVVATLGFTLLMFSATSQAGPRSIRQDGQPTGGDACADAILADASDHYSGYDFIGFADGGLSGSMVCEEKSPWSNPTPYPTDINPYFDSSVSPGFVYDIDGGIPHFDYDPSSNQPFAQVGRFATVVAPSNPQWGWRTLEIAFWQQTFVINSPWYGFEPAGLMLVKFGGTVFDAGSPLQLDGSTTYVSKDGVKVWDAGNYHGEYLCFGHADRNSPWGFLGVLDGNFAGGQTACHDQPLSVEPYLITGFFQPVDNLPTPNVAKAGRAIPLKWRLTDVRGAPVTTLTSVSVTVSSLVCAIGSTADALEEYSAGSSGLQNLGDGYYQYNWKTPTSYARSCKTVKVDVGDGVVLTAEFQFTR